MSVIYFKPCLNLLEPNLALQKCWLHKGPHHAVSLAVAQSCEPFHPSTLDTKSCTRVSLRWEALFWTYLQSTGEKTWGGCSRKAQELEQLRQYKKEIPEVGRKRAGQLWNQCRSLWHFKQQGSQGTALLPPTRSSPKFSPIHSENYLWSLHSISLPQQAYISRPWLDGFFFNTRNVPLLPQVKLHNPSFIFHS